MERLTTNKLVDEMSMLELAYNSCYVENGKARYRDFEMNMDARDYARNLMVTLVGEELPLDDEAFDEEMHDNLQYDQFSDVKGVIALFYRNLWAMADLRENLKVYEETGLNPERIEEINELYLEKCKEVNRLEAKLEEYRNYAENILQKLIAVSFESQGFDVGMGGQQVVAMDDVVEILKGSAE